MSSVLSAANRENISPLMRPEALGTTVVIICGFPHFSLKLHIYCKAFPVFKASLFHVLIGTL